MPYYAGIDGGGSKTACAVGGEKAVLGRGLAPSCKIARVGPEMARGALEAALLQACQQAGISFRELSAVCMGIAGAARSEVVEATRKLVEDFLYCPLEIVGDMVIALEAAFAGDQGLIVIAGTGSICFGRNARGQTARAGGWGSLISDEGSGEWIGRRAVALTLRAHDSGQNTALLPALLSAWKAGTRDEISTRANAMPPPDFSQLLPLVVEAAQAGDALAASILNEAGQELAALASIVVRKLWPARNTVPVRLAGGVFNSSQRVREVFTLLLQAQHQEVSVSYEPVEPVLGALELARKMASGSNVTGQSYP